MLFGVTGMDEDYFAGRGIAVGFLEDLEFSLKIAERLASESSLGAVGLEMGGGSFEALAELAGVVAGGGFGFLGVVECYLEAGAELAGGFKIYRECGGGIECNQAALDFGFRGFVCGGGCGEFGS